MCLCSYRLSALSLIALYVCYGRPLYAFRTNDRLRATLSVSRTASVSFGDLRSDRGALQDQDITGRANRTRGTRHLAVAENCLLRAKINLDDVRRIIRLLACFLHFQTPPSCRIPRFFPPLFTPLNVVTKSGQACSGRACTVSVRLTGATFWSFT
jgi:hypothetical protein